MWASRKAFAPRLAALLLLAGLLAGCGGSDPDDATGANDPPPAGGDGGDGGDGGANGTPTGALADDSVAASTPLAITFSEPMDAASLSLAGSLAAYAGSEWLSDTRLQLTPAGYWPPGEQTLLLDAADRDGTAMATLEARITVAAPFATYQAAAVVIGQQDFGNGAARQDENAPTADANTLDHAGGIAWAEDEQLLFIADSGDSRVLAFDGVPEVNNANATFVLGQPDFSSSTGGTTQGSYRTPIGISADLGRLIVGDQNSNRLLIHEPVPLSGPALADAVVGQDDFEAHDDTCERGRMNHVHGHFVTPSGRLLVTDSQNNRLLIWDELPREIGALPDRVLGQPSFVQCAANDANRNGIAEEDEAASASTLQHPTSAWSDDERLVVVDNYNSRVLIWNTFPGNSLEPADIVLGQAGMDMIAPNDDDQDGVPDAAASARTLNFPWQVWVQNGQLFVTDESNNRVLIWNEWPRQSFEPADVVLGQQDFAARAANEGAEQPSARSLDGPKGVRVVGDRLLVADAGNSRVLVYAAR